METKQSVDIIIAIQGPVCERTWAIYILHCNFDTSGIVGERVALTVVRLDIGIDGYPAIGITASNDGSTGMQESTIAKERDNDS